MNPVLCSSSYSPLPRLCIGHSETRHMAGPCDGRSRQLTGPCDGLTRHNYRNPLPATGDGMNRRHGPKGEGSGSLSLKNNHSLTVLCPESSCPKHLSQAQGWLGQCTLQALVATRQLCSPAQLAFKPGRNHQSARGSSAAQVWLKEYLVHVSLCIHKSL